MGLPVGVPVGIGGAQWQRTVPTTNPKVFNVFNVGTGHTQREANNTIAMLGLLSTDDKVINDGPCGPIGEKIGWGMNTALESTFAQILHAAPMPTVVNMLGHSRGAVLCHM